MDNSTDKDGKGSKKNGLHIEIDENANIAEQDDQAQQMLFENVMKNENKMAVATDPQSVEVGAQPNQMMQHEEEDEEQYTEEAII